MVPLDRADTVQVTEAYMRPPLPYEPVASSRRSNEEPMLRGALNTTVGAIGLREVSVLTVALGAVGLIEQVEGVPVQKALSNPPFRVTKSPAFRNTTSISRLVA
jgi:hypothetical protein